jgi:hypothetical protein
VFRSLTHSNAHTHLLSNNSELSASRENQSPEPRSIEVARGLERAPYHIIRLSFRSSILKGVYLPRAGRQVSCSGGSTCLPAIPNMAARFCVTSRPLPRFKLIYYVSPKLSQVFSRSPTSTREFSCLSPTHVHKVFSVLISGCGTSLPDLTHDLTLQEHNGRG